jgi:hypothetical protein
VFVTNDPRSFSEAVAKALVSPAGDPERLAALVKEFSWQGQEKVIVDYYNGLTGYHGRVPGDEEFPSLEITEETRDRELAVPATPHPDTTHGVTP